MWVKLTIPMFALMGSVLTAGASEILHDDVLSTQNPKLDRMITGANHNPVSIKDLPLGEPSRIDCPLCFHRELLKKKQSGNTGAGQDFPGDTNQ